MDLESAGVEFEDYLLQVIDEYPPWTWSDDECSPPPSPPSSPPPSSPPSSPGGDPPSPPNGERPSGPPGSTPPPWEPFDSSSDEEGNGGDGSIWCPLIPPEPGLVEQGFDQWFSKMTGKRVAHKELIALHEGLFTTFMGPVSRTSKRSKKLHLEAIDVHFPQILQEMESETFCRAFVGILCPSLLEKKPPTTRRQQEMAEWMLLKSGLTMP